MNTKIFKTAFWVLMLTGVLNWMAYKLYLYWTIWWIDSVVHFFAGVSVALFTLWLYSIKEDLSGWSIRKVFKVAMISVITIGILWELYELYLGVTLLSDGIHYWTDTISDLISDIVGGILGFFYVRSILKNKND